MDYVHVAIDDHTRLAHAEVLCDERTGTCAGFLTRAAAWFAAHGITVTRVLTDNAKSYRADQRKIWQLILSPRHRLLIENALRRAHATNAINVRLAGQRSLP